MGLEFAFAVHAFVNREGEFGAAGKADGFLAFENGGMVLVSTIGGDCWSPAVALGVAIDGINDVEAGSGGVGERAAEFYFVGNGGSGIGGTPRPGPLLVEE